jgi:hypothetical protein
MRHPGIQSWRPKRSLTNVEFSPVFGCHNRSTAFTVMAVFVSDKVGRASLQADPADEHERQNWLALQLDITEGALKTAIHRMRRKSGIILREIVTLTLHHNEDLELEIQLLVVVIASSNRVSDLTKTGEFG